MNAALEYVEPRWRIHPASQEVTMVRISVFYATSEGKKFDHDYYVNRHMKLVRERLGSFGLIRTEVDKGMAVGGRGAPAAGGQVGHWGIGCVSRRQKGESE